MFVHAASSGDGNSRRGCGGRNRRLLRGVSIGVKHCERRVDIIFCFRFDLKQRRLRRHDHDGERHIILCRQCDQPHVGRGTGTFHFNNGSVTFLGVEFQTICTDYASGCPGVPPPPANTTYTVATGAGITLNLTFPDHSSEVIAGAFPLVPVYFHAVSQHTNTQAGILIVYADSSPSYKSYLLVSTSSTSGRRRDFLEYNGRDRHGDDDPHD